MADNEKWSKLGRPIQGAVLTTANWVPWSRPKTAAAT
jgi:hypothetical protein